MRYLASRFGFYRRDFLFLRRSIFTAINLNYIFRCKEEKIWHQIFLILDRFPLRLSSSIYQIQDYDFKTNKLYTILLISNCLLLSENNECN